MEQAAALVQLLLDQGHVWMLVLLCLTIVVVAALWQRRHKGQIFIHGWSVECGMGENGKKRGRREADGREKREVVLGENGKKRGRREADGREEMWCWKRMGRRGEERGREEREADGREWEEEGEKRG